MRLLLRATGLLLSLLAASAALAQTGGFEVVVTDVASGAPLPGATVVLTSETRLVPETALGTGADGRARFPVLRAGGGYAIEVRLPGYATVYLPDLRVSLGRSVSIPVGLFPEMQETVDVRARREGVELDQTATSTTFSGEFVEDLPLRGRFYQTVLTLAPGVLDSDEDGNPNVHGARVTDFKTQVGGVSNTDPLTGGFLSYVNLESVDALEIVTAGAGAEFGRAQGGFANIVQKQGSNSFEGVAGVLWNTSRLDGNGAADVAVPEYDWVQPHLQVSGPILRDRLWYRLSHEWIDKEDPVNLLGEVVVVRRRQAMHSDQVTWQATPRNKLTLQYQQDPLQVDGMGISSLVPPESAVTFLRGGDATTLTWTAPYSARLFVEGLAAWQDHREEVFPSHAGVRNDCVISDEFPNLPFARCVHEQTGFVTGSHAVDSRDRRQRFTVQAQGTLSLASQRPVSHQLKAGMTVENERYFRRLSRGGEMLLILPPPFGGSVARVPTEVHVPNAFGARTVGTSYGLFVEDQIRLGTRWSVTAGLRLDREEIDGRAREPFDPAAESARVLADCPDGGDACIVAAMRAHFTGFEGGSDYLAALADLLDALEANLPPLESLYGDSQSWRKRRLGNVALRNTLLSPRLAVAWDPWGTAKTKLAITAGRYHDKVFLSVPLLAAEAPTSTVPFVADRFGRGQWFVSRTDRGIEPNARLTMVDPGLRTPYQDELTLAAERELWPECSLKITWVRRRFRDQLQDVDLNHAAGDHGSCHVWTPSDPVSLVPSPGAGQPIVDPYTGEAYVDTDPGNGDGRLDDCTGTLSQPGGLLSPHVLSPDGLPDLYTLNPVWGQVMLVSNVNTADYSGVVLELVRRHARGFEANASYTWSRAVGDAEQYDQLLGDDPSAVQEERSFLSYDQRHVFKVAAAVDTPSGWRLGTAVRFESGLPYSVLEQVNSFYAFSPVYRLQEPASQVRYRYVGKRNDRRNPGFWNFDFRVSREFRLRGGSTFGLTGELFNVLNDDTLRILEVRGGEVEGVRRFGRRFQVGLRTSF